MAIQWNITADSTPVLDGWGWADYWKIEDWIIWHKSMKGKFGRDEANRRFIEQWHKQDSDANPFNQRNFNGTFRTYARENGFFDQLFTGIGFISKPLGWMTDLFNSADHAESAAIGIVDNTAKGAITTGKILKYAIPVAVIIIIAAGAFYIYRTVKK